jgi:hypothetical protein
MPSGGLLRDPSLLFSSDGHFQRTTLVQLCICLLLLTLSAFYHYVLQQKGTKSKLLEGLKDEDVAEIDTIIVYPIKSCHGVTLDSVDVTRKGFKYDRRWLIVAKEGVKPLSLREEPKLTFIIPSFDEEGGQKVMRLRLSANAGMEMPDIEIPLEPSPSTFSSWHLLPPLDFYGSTAQGRVVEAVRGISQWNESPSEWISKVSDVDL